MCLGSVIFLIYFLKNILFTIFSKVLCQVEASQKKYIFVQNCVAFPTDPFSFFLQVQILDSHFIPFRYVGFPNTFKLVSGSPNIIFLNLKRLGHIGPGELILLQS